MAKRNIFFVSIVILQFASCQKLNDPVIDESKLLDEWTEKINKFKRDLAESAVDIADDHQSQEQRLSRQKRSFQINDDIHHSYIFDILPDRIDELFVDGTRNANIEELYNCESFHYLPVLRKDRKRDNLLLTFGDGQISFFSYNTSTNALANASMPFLPKHMKTGFDDTSLVQFTVVTKNIERFDLDRLMIVAARSGNKYFIRVFEVDYRLPEDSITGCIFHKVSTVGLDYTRGTSILTLSAVSGDAIFHRLKGQYRVWLAALVQRPNITNYHIDVHSIENYDGDYRYSTVYSYKASLPTISKIQILKIFEFIVVIESNYGHYPYVHITYFVEHEKVYKPYQMRVSLANGGIITDVKYFTYGSRSFLLISNTLHGQYIKEVVSYGNRIAIEDFRIVDVPSGLEWLVINIPTCRDEKLIYLFYQNHGVTGVYVAKFGKLGLEIVTSPEIVPVYYLEPGYGIFTSLDTRIFYDKESARKACIANPPCAGIAESEAKTFFMGYQVGPQNGGIPRKGLFKKHVPDGADLNAVLGNSDPVFGKMYTFTADGQGHIILKLLSGQTVIIDIIVHLETIERRVVLENAEIYNRLKNLTTFVEEHESVVNKTLDTLNRAVKPNGSQNLTNVTTIKFVTDPEITTDNITFLNVTFENSTLVTEDLAIDIDELTENVTTIHESLKQLLEKLEDAVFKDEEANVTGTKWIKGLIKLYESINVTTLNINKIFNEDVTKLLEETYRRDQPKPIKGKKTYTSVEVDGDVTTERLNSLNISKDLVTTTTDQTIHGETTIVNPVTITKDVYVDNLNDIDPSEETVPLHGNKTITSHKTFTSVVRAKVINVKTYSTVDEVDLSELSHNVLTTDSNETLLGSLTFTKDLRVTGDVLLNRINQVNVNDLDAFTVRVDRTSIITGLKKFNNVVTIHGDITVEGEVNGLKTTDIFTNTKSHTFTASKWFEKVSVTDIQISGTVSELTLPDDIVTLTTDQVITGKHYFENGITGKRDIIINGSVDGVRISELETRVIRFSNRTVIQGNVTFTSATVIKKSIQVLGRMNGINLKDVAEDIVYDYESNVTIAARKRFTSELKCSDKLVVDSRVDGFRIPDDFVDVYSNQTISGHKTFEYARFKEITVEGLIDKVNISHVKDSVVTLSTDQNVTSLLNFIKTVHIKRGLIVDIYRTIDGVDVSELVSRNSSESVTITGAKTFTRITIRDLVVRRDIVCEIIDEVDLSLIFNRRVTLTTEQDIFDRWTLENSTVENLEIVGLINGINFTELVDDVMSLTKDQWVTGSKNFNGQTPELLQLATLAITSSQAAAEIICTAAGLSPEECKIMVLPNGNLLVCDGAILRENTQTTIINGKAKSNYGINGFRLDKLREYAVKIHNNSVVTGTFTFNNEFRVTKDVYVPGLVDYTNLTDLYFHAVRKTSITQEVGDKIFENGFHVHGSIYAKKINGFKVPDDVLTVHTDQTTANVKYTFDKTVAVSTEVDNDANITVCDQQDMANCVSFDLSDFASNVARIDLNQTIEGDIIFNVTLRIAGDLIVENLIDNLDINAVLNRSVRTTGGNVDTLIINSNSTVNITGDIITETINSIKFLEFINRTMRTDKDAAVVSHKKIHELLIIGVVTSDKLYVGGLIDGTNITDLEENSLKINKDEIISGEVTFNSSLTINHDIKVEVTINNFDLEDDLVTIKTDQDIYGHKSLEHVRFRNNVEVRGLVNHYNLTELYKDTLLITDEQTIDGYKHIENADFKNLTCATVNGVSTDDYVTLTTEQNIYGKLTFVKKTSFKHLYVQGYINEKNITEISRNALYLNETENVTASMTFQHKVTFHNNVTIAEGKTIDGVDLNVLYRQQYAFRQYVSQAIANLTIEHRDICYEISAFNHVIEKSAFFTDYRNHPVIIQSLPQVSHLFDFDGYLFAIKKEQLCSATDTFGALDLFSDSSPLSSTGLGVLGDILSVQYDANVVLFHKKSDDSCSDADYQNSFIFVGGVKQAVDLPLAAPSEQASLLVHDNYVFVSFVYGSGLISSTVYKIDINNLNDPPVLLSSTNSAAANHGTLFKVYGQLYFVEVQHTGFTSTIFVSQIIDNFSKLKVINVYTSYKIGALSPVTIGNKVYFTTYKPTPGIRSGYYKFSKLPQPATFTLFRFDQNAAIEAGKTNPSFIPVQALAIEFQFFKTFSVTLGGTTINYSLFVKETSIDIYIFEGIACYQLNGIIDLTAELSRGEVITFVNTIKSDYVPTILVQTSSSRTFLFEAVHNGYAITDTNLQCHQ